MLVVLGPPWTLLWPWENLEYLSVAAADIVTAAAAKTADAAGVGNAGIGDPMQQMGAAVPCDGLVMEGL